MPGSNAMARANPTRFCIPPEISEGIFSRSFSMTVEQKVAFPLSRHTELSADDLKKRAHELLASVGIVLRSHVASSRKENNNESNQQHVRKNDKQG